MTTRETAAASLVQVLDSEFLRALTEPARLVLMKVLLLEGPSEAAAASPAAGASEKRPRPDSEEGGAAADEARVVRACLGYATGLPTEQQQQQEAVMPRAAFGALLRMLAPRPRFIPHFGVASGRADRAFLEQAFVL